MSDFAELILTMLDLLSLVLMSPSGFLHRLWIWKSFIMYKMASIWVESTSSKFHSDAALFYFLIWWKEGCDFDTGEVVSFLLMKVKLDLYDACLSFINRYGNYLKLLKDDALHDLTLLMKHMKTFLSTQRIKSSSQLSILLKDLIFIWVQ